MGKNASSINPIDTSKEIIEVLPSPSINSNLKRRPGQSIPWLLIILSTILVCVSLVFIFLKTQDKKQNFLNGQHLSLPSITKSIVNKSTSPLNKPLAQVTITPVASTNSPVTTPSTTSPSTTSSSVLNVSGILSNDNHNVALINDTIYEEGSIINGIKIVKINLDAITIERDGKEETIIVKK